MINPYPSLRSALPAALAALSLVAGVHSSCAQSSSLAEPQALGLPHTQLPPYNFTGRVFDLGDSIGFGSGSLLRRQTVLTAGHVVFDPTTGFSTATTFTRALYEDYSLSKSSVTSVSALSGYTAVVGLEGNATEDAFQLDQGILLLGTAPVDENWATFTYDPTLLTAANAQTFVLGYPGVTFDGRTLAYIVPPSEYVTINGSGVSGSLENDSYSAEEGMSGGPVFVAEGIGEQYVAGSTVGGIDDSTGEFNASFIRVIDKTSRKFIDDAEFASGLIKKVKVSGPKVVTRGTTVTFKVYPVFLDPDVNGNRNITTDRYDNITLGTSTPLITNSPSVHITKTSNTTFDVTFDAGLPSNSTTTLQAYYDKKSLSVTPNSSLLVTIK